MMVRKQERLGLGQALEVKIPTLFRCPISLDVMRSPVSLCTGVTYDRASIQRWLESGNTTCPATMLPLPSTDLVPNLTLQRLIHHWSAAAAAAAAAADSPAPLMTRRLAGDLLRDLSSTAPTSDHDPVRLLRKLADFFSADDVDEIDKNDLVNSGGCSTVLVSLLVRKDSKLEVAVAVARVLSLIVTSDFITESNKKIAASHLISHLDCSVSALIRVLRDGDSLESRINAATVLDAITAASDAESKILIGDKDELIGELVRLIGSSDEKSAKMNRRAVEAGLGCLAGIATAKRIRPRMVRAGVVPMLARVLAADPAVAPPSAAGKALRIMEAASGCAEGRAAICKDGAAAVTAVVGRMVKAGKDGAEAAVAVLWSVCHAFRDRPAVEAVAAAEGVTTKLLLLMQSGCSPAARQMAADLLKIFRVNSKSCLAGYDTKTTHITPF